MMLLSKNERHSAVWVKIAEHFQKRLSESRQENDGRLDEIETARLRGRIAAFKEILALGNPPEPDASGSDADNAPGSEG